MASIGLTKPKQGAISLAAKFSILTFSILPAIGQAGFIQLSDKKLAEISAQSYEHSGYMNTSNLSLDTGLFIVETDLHLASLANLIDDERPMTFSLPNHIDYARVTWRYSNLPDLHLYNIQINGAITFHP